MLVAVVMRRAGTSIVVGVVVGIAFVRITGITSSSSPSLPETDRVSMTTPDEPAAQDHERQRLAEIASSPLLVSGDTAEGIAAIEEAVRSGTVEVLGVLEATDLAREPESAPTIIHAIAELARRGSEADRAHAAATLARWLETEAVRPDRDAAGNVPNIVEALGELGGSAAADALAAALDGRKLDLSVETLAVETLGVLGDPHAHASIERFAARIADAPAAEDDFERELHAEAVAAARNALQRTGGT